MSKHEEWFVGVQQKCFYERGEQSWYNAMSWYPDHKAGQRYARTQEEAEKVLDNAYKLWNGEHVYNEKGERYETHEAGMLGITTVSTKKSDDDMRIVKHIIKKRIVTDWETVEEE